MSSHREAPEISKDPVADSTDVYAFVSPDQPDTVTIIANYLPLQQPNGGPNFYEFDDDVQYDINVNYQGNPKPNLIYRFRFKTTIRNPDTFLYNTGVIDSPTSTAWNRPQTFSCTMIDVTGGKTQVIAEDQPVPPCNVGVRSTPDYADIAEQAIYTSGKRKIFCGQRADAFRVDLGSVFDLGGLRPLNEAHLIPLAKMDGINAVKPYNVHSIAIQVPITEVVHNRNMPKDPKQRIASIGIWTTASRQKATMFDEKQYKYVGTGPFQPVSRLANPLFNEVLVPMSRKDEWNATQPLFDRRFAQYVTRPELQGLLPYLYPGAFPHLASYDKPRADLNAILLTGIPYGVVKDADGDPLPFATYTGGRQADMLRLNVAIPPTQKDDDSYSELGVIGGDLAGFPNGRRPADDVTTIELRAIAGATIPLVDPDYEPDAVVSQVADGSNENDTRDTESFTNGNLNAPLLDVFPYLGHPNGGYQTTTGYSTSSSDGYGEQPTG